MQLAQPKLLRVYDLTSIDDTGHRDNQSKSKRAPKLGEAATGRVTASRVVEIPDPKTPEERVTAAAAALAEGAGPIAERLTYREATAVGAPPELALVYARAVETAQDLSVVHRTERARAAYERVLEVWPAAWEAILSHAVLAGARRGQSEARIETLKDLDGYREKAGPYAAPVPQLFQLASCAQFQLPAEHSPPGLRIVETTNLRI